MKGILKRIGAMLLILTLFTQSWGVHVYAAEDIESTALEVEITDSKNSSEDNVETELDDTSEEIEETEENVLEDSSGAEELKENLEESEDTEQPSEDTGESDDIQEEQSIADWIEENIPENHDELLDRPREWWDSLTPNQRLVAEIFAEPIEIDNSFYREQSLDEIIQIIESGEVEISKFFEKTIFQYITLEQLYELKDMELDLYELGDVILDIWAECKVPEDETILEMAIMVSGLSPFMSLFDPTQGDMVTNIQTRDSGYTDGKGNKFWILTNNGKYVYCLDHGKSCSRDYIYGNMHEVNSKAAWLITNYGQATGSDEGYMAIQMAVWALQAGQSIDTVQDYAYGWFVNGGVSKADALAWAQTTKQFFNLAKESGKCYVVEGPTGSQTIGGGEFKLTPYTGGGTGGEEPGPTPVEPEFATIEDSITVTYEIKVRKADWQTNVGLAGCVVDIYENGSKVDTVTTNASGQASYETTKSASFSAEYCTNYDQLTPEQQATITCFTSLAEAQADIEAQKSDFANTSYSYSCREVTAPTGYVWQANEKSASVKGNGSATLNITNERTLGAVELIKYDTESESNIMQGEATLEGAVYGIYAAENIVHQDKKTGVIYQKDQLIATGTIGKSPKRNANGYILNTDGSRHIEKPGGTIAYVDTPGKTLFGDLELGKYYIKEITPAEGYMLDETIYDVTFTYKDQMVKVETRDETAADAENTLTVDDESSSKTVYSGDYVIKQGIQFVKTSDNTYQTELKPIAGAGFSVYLISDLSGVKDGTLTPVNGTWGADDIMTFYDYDFTDEPKAVLYKRTIETWTDGDTKWLTSLGGNKYEVAEMFTDEDGRIETPELPYGTYVIVETTTPENHVCAKPFIAYVTQDGGVLYTDATKQKVEKTYTAEDAIRYGDREATKDKEGRVLQKQRIINNTITKTFLRVVKADEEFLVQPGSYIKPEEVVRGTVLKEGAQYRVRCLTFDISEESLKALNWKYDADGYLSYYVPNAKAEMGTADNPFTTSFLRSGGKIKDCYITLPQELPIGSYELIEITAPGGYVLNGSEQAVQDTGTGRVNGYEIVDAPKAKVVFTIGNGSVYPDGQMGTNKYALQDSYGNLTVTVLQKNHEQKGIIEIYKHGEQVSVVEKDTKTLLDKLPKTPIRDIMSKVEASHQDAIFKYEDAPVEGAQFNIIAIEDIYTQELDEDLFSQYDVNIEDYLLHKEGDVVATITTDRNGWGYASGLYIGKYKIVETVAGSGFVLNTTETEFEITPQDQTVSFDIHSADYKNERQKLEISVTKTDAESGENLAGAVYGLYAAEDIHTNIEYAAAADKWIVRDTPEILIAKDALVATCITDDSGKAAFDEDLPLGKYYVRELEAPLGYFNALDDVLINASYTDEKGGQDVEKQEHTAAFENYATKAVITKQDLTNGEELAGATLEVFDESGNKIDSWISKGPGQDVHYFFENDEGFLEEISKPAELPAEKVLITKEGHLIEGLQLGIEYILRETKTAPGYVTAEEIRFKLIQETDAEGKLTGIAGMYSTDGTDWTRSADDILIMKDDVTKLEISKKDVTNGEELPGATLEIYDESGKLITSWVSADKPHYIEKLPVGKYTLVEKYAPAGYGYAADIAFEIKDTGELHKVEMYDDVQKLDVEKSTISLTQRGDTYKYSIDVIKNCTDAAMDKFTMTDTLPGHVRLTELWTGTYNQTLKYSVEYRTNKNSEWIVWKEELDTDTIHHLTLPDTLAEGEHITSFRFCFGTVGGMFENVVCPVYMVNVQPDAAGVLKNIVELTGEQNGVGYLDRDFTETRIYLKNISGYSPEGGDEPQYDITGSWDGGTDRDGLNGYPNSGTKTGTSGQPIPVTGDSAMVILWIGLIIIAAVAFVAIHNKRKRDE